MFEICSNISSLKNIGVPTEMLSYLLLIISFHMQGEMKDEFVPVMVNIQKMFLF